MENGDRKPSVRQVYAVAAALCERTGEQFPETMAEASELIERLRIENGHPAPRLEDALRPRRRSRRGSGDGRGVDKLATAIARRLAEEMR